MLRRSMLAMVTAVMVWATAPADALVLCVKGKSGAVKEGAPIKLRTACTRKEVRVDPDAAGLRGPQGAPGRDGADGIDGTDGSPGMNGSNGVDGTDGAPGLAALEIVTQQGTPIINNTLATASATASCPAGKKVLGGGLSYTSFGFFLVPPRTVVSRPITTEPQGWTASAEGQNNDDWGVTAYAICAAAAP